MMQKINKYFSKHPTNNAVVHSLAGIGVGIIIASPVAGEHPIRWGVLFLLAAALGHWYAANAK